MGAMTPLERYLQSVKITQGQNAGKRLRLLDWQREFLAGALGPGVSEAAISMARGNGKSAFLASVAAACIDGPLAVPRAEVICCASSLQQAKIVYDHAVRFIESRRVDLTDRKQWRRADSVNHALLEHKPSGARLRCIGSDPKRAHGLAPALVLADEPAQWPVNQRDAMLAALRTSLGKIPGSRLVALGTRSADPAHWFTEMLDSGDYVLDYSVPSDAPAETWGEPATWALANPSLAAFPELRKQIEREWERTVGNPSALASFRALRLNQGVADTMTRSLVESADWLAAEGDAPAEGDYVLGVDLGGSRSMSAAVGFWPASGRLEGLAAFPEVPGLIERERMDRAAEGAYRRMEESGELILAGRRVADIAALIGTALDRWGEPWGVATDRFRRAEFEQVCEGLDWYPAVEWRSLMPSQSAEDVRLFRREFHEGRVTPVRSLLLRHSLAEAVTRSDNLGNESLTKRNTQARDDVTMAAVLGVAAASRNSEYGGPQAHSGRSRVVVL